MDLHLKDRVAVITGGTSGIGLATAKLFLQDGANVAVCGRDVDRLETARMELEAVAGAERVLAARCDVLDCAEVENFRDAVLARFGQADMLINNAGQARQSRFADTDDGAWRDELELKFFSLIYPIRAFQAALRESDAGAIVCTNALLARQPFSGMVATSAARAGALNLVKSLADELAPEGIRVNAVLLGLIDSGQWRRRYDALPDKPGTREAWLAQTAKERGIPLGRLGRAEEPAAAIVFLASQAASFITGTSLDVSGGHARYI